MNSLTPTVVLAATIIIMAYLPKIALSWSMAIGDTPWSAPSWARLDVFRRIGVGVYTILSWIVWPADKAVQWAKFLILRMHINDDARPNLASFALTSAVAAVTLGAIGGFTSTALLAGAAVGLVIALVLRAVRVHVRRAHSDDTGLVFDLRPALAIMALTVLIIVLT